VHSPCGLR